MQLAGMLAVGAARPERCSLMYTGDVADIQLEVASFKDVVHFCNISGVRCMLL
jgi:hypothetical protein